MAISSLCAVHRCAQVSATGGYSSDHISDSDNCERDVFIKEGGGVMEAGQVSHT